ncbi:MAG: hypothetical protein U1F20_06510 [Lysobacterales bacterium]
MPKKPRVSTPAPILVEHVEEVEDIQAHDRLVALEDAGEFLLQAEVELVGPRLEGGIACRDLAAVGTQVRVAVDELWKASIWSCVAEPVIHDQVVAQRDVGQILVRDVVAVDVRAEGPAVEQAGVAVVEQGDRGPVVAEERMLPVRVP